METGQVSTEAGPGAGEAAGSGGTAGNVGTASARRLLVLLLLVALAPVLAVVLTRVGRRYFPVSDAANIDLLVRDVFSAHPPLVGPYSRGYNHPGPSLFWALAPLSGITGGAPWATLVGAALLQGVAIVGVGLLAFRRGGIALGALMLAVLALVYSGLGQGGPFVVPWNPFVAVPFFLLFLLAAWSLATGDRWQAVTAVATGTFAVQAHIGDAPLVVAGLVWAGLVVVLDRPPATHAPRWRTVLAWVGVVVVVMWTAPVVQQLRDQPGNLREIWRYFTSGAPTLGIGTGAGLLATEFRVLPPWLGGSESFSFGSSAAQPASTGWLLVAVAVLAVGWWCAHRSNRRADRRMVELAGLMTVVAIVALSRISVDPSPYLFYWRIVVAAFAVAASAYAIANWWPVAAHPRARVGVAIALGAALVIGAGTQVLDVVNHSDRVATTEAAAEHLMDQLRRGGLPHQPFLVRAVGNNLGGVEQGLVDALDRAGAPVRVDERYAYRFGFHRGASPAQVHDAWYVSEEGHDLSLLPERDGARLLAWSSPLRRVDERELQRLQRDAAAALGAAGQSDRIPLLDSPFLAALAARDPLPGVAPAAVARMAAYNRQVAAARTCRCSVVALPSSAPGPADVSG